MKRALIIFTRVPEENKTKTRLMPHYSPAQCVGLHVAMLKDLAVQIKSIANETAVFIYYTPAADISVLENIFGTKICYKLQAEGELGEKMYKAIAETLEAGYELVNLMGSDIPEVTAKDIEEAFKILENKDVVFGPTLDGGYYLVGMKKPICEIFNIESYGGASVFEDTKRAVKNMGLEPGYCRKCSDIDTSSDIEEYLVRMEHDEAFRKTNTGRYLLDNRKIAIIIPTYNEAETVTSLQRQLEHLREECEIVFVDGGSTDNTTALIDSTRFRLLHSKKGRNNQMNLGAESVEADILFFLHCDSELPADPVKEIRELMAKHRAGCFGIAFRTLSPLMFICRYISNHRVFDRKVMFGDQGIVVEKKLFMEAGMYPDLPIMEDYQFSLTLKEMGIKLGMTRHRIYTSARRFKGGPVRKLRLMWKMNRLRKKYRDGVDINIIAAMYRDVR